MGIFKLLYIQKKSPSKIAFELHRSVSTITREIKKGLDSGAYNPFIAEFEHLKSRRFQSVNTEVKLQFFTGVALQSFGKKF